MTGPPAAAPLREFVLKVHSRCNLSCDYCYVYTMGDDSWRGRPLRMPPDVVESSVRRIADHARTHHLRTLGVIFHGGEPLLAGPEHLLDIVARLRRDLPDTTRARFTVQTNGTLLPIDTLELFLRNDIRVGVSLDGGTAELNRHRTLPTGRGSHAQVMAGLRRLTEPPYSRIFGGILCTVDIARDPTQVYESLLPFRPPVIDFLLPHANWSRPPPRPPGSRPTAYADWLIRVFDRWYDAPLAETQIRLFQSIIGALLGHSRPSDQIGLAPAVTVVVETDGRIEQVDTLKSAYPNAADTGMTVFDNSFDEVLRHPGFTARQGGLDVLSPICRTCEIVSVCGGGHYAHRYRRANGFENASAGFDNPSVYCPDLMPLIRHVEARISRSLTGVTVGGTAGVTATGTVGVTSPGVSGV